MESKGIASNSEINLRERSWKSKGTPFRNRRGHPWKSKGISLGYKGKPLGNLRDSFDHLETTRGFPLGSERKSKAIPLGSRGGPLNSKIKLREYPWKAREGLRRFPWKSKGDAFECKDKFTGMLLEI